MVQFLGFRSIVEKQNIIGQKHNDDFTAFSFKKGILEKNDPKGQGVIEEKLLKLFPFSDKIKQTLDFMLRNP